MKKLIVILMCLCMLLMSGSCGRRDVKIEEKEIRDIGELATLECTFNNIAFVEAPKKKGISHWFEKDRELWIEYKGTVKIGIDMSKVEPEVDGEEVKITIPKAEILSINKKSDTIEVVSSKDGLLNKNKVTGEEQEQAIEKAQEEMKKAMLNQKEIFDSAQERAKDLIENYVKQISEVSGKKYTIVWKELSE